MRLLFIIHSLKFGGAERQLVELIKGLNCYLYDVHLICLKEVTEGYTDLLKTEGIKIRYFTRAHKYDVRPLFSIYRYIKETQIDMVHAFENLGGLIGLIAAKLSARPIVCSAIRDAKDKNFKLKLSKKLLARFANFIVANSRAGFANRFKVMKPHFRIIYNGVDFNRFQQIGKDCMVLRTDLGVHKYKNVIGMVASLTERKDHDTLLDAAPIILQSCPETSFLFVGDGEKRNKLSEKVKLLGLKDNVFFLGHRLDVDRIHQIFDILVLLSNPDVHLEGTPNAIIEAMAIGVPVVASRGGGTDEIVKHGVNGILVSPKNKYNTAEAILELLRNKQKAQKLANAARFSVREKFNLHRYVNEYENIYKELSPDRWRR